MSCYRIFSDGQQCYAQLGPDTVLRPGPDFERFNDYAGQRDLLAQASPECRAAALRVLAERFAEGYDPYVADTTPDGHVYMVWGDFDCVVTPWGRVRQGPYVRDGELIEPFSLYCSS